MEEGEGYTFTLHLCWMPAILLGFIASIHTLYIEPAQKVLVGSKTYRFDVSY